MHQKILNKRKITLKFNKYIITLGLSDTFGYIIFFTYLVINSSVLYVNKQLTLNPLACGVNYNKTWLELSQKSAVFTLDLKLITENILQSLVVLWSIHEHISHIKNVFISSNHWFIFVYYELWTLEIKFIQSLLTIRQKWVIIKGNDNHSA